MPTGQYQNLYQKENFNPDDYPITYLFKGIKIHSDGELSESELTYLVNKGRGMWNYLTDIYVNHDGEYLEVGYETRDCAFERIRRITGYLVGTLDRFNDAKAAEEQARVKHQVSS